MSNVNGGPVFTSGSEVTVNENQTAAYTAEVADHGGAALTYSLSGIDASLFNIDENTGVVSFRNGPDYENPGDTDGNNVYDITITATDSNELSTSQDVTIGVADAHEMIVLSEVQWDNTDLGFVISNDETRQFNILNVSSAGDVNGDGYDDIIIGSTTPGPHVPAVAYVVYGGSELSDIDLSEIQGDFANVGNFDNFGDPKVQSDLGFVVAGDSRDYLEWAGSKINGGGDINGDGFDDLYIGGSHSPVSYVLYGGSNLVNTRASAIESNGANGIAIQGVYTVEDHPIQGEEFTVTDISAFINGRVAFFVGDLNGDGIDDMAISEREVVEGKLVQDMHVVFGGKNLSDVKLSEIAAGNGGFVIKGLESARLDSAGDVNGDGYDDLFISEGQANTHNGDKSGIAYVIFGASENNLSDIEIDEVERGSGGFAIYGASEDDRSGKNIRSVGDINGDGLGDLVIANSEFGSSQEAKSVDHYVVYGKTDTDAVELADIAQGIGGFVIRAPNAVGGHAIDVSHAGDVNGDGFDDLVIGSSPLDPGDANPTPTPTPTPGLTYVIYGGQNVSTHALVGTSDDDVLEGSSHADQIIAGQGNDILMGNGGGDVLRGGAGDDIIAIHDLLFRSLDGGNGIDTLRFDTPLRLNFTRFSDNWITGVEKIDLRADGGNSHLIFNLSDVFNLSDSSGDTLSIHGSRGDSVELRKYSFAQNGDWVRSEEGPDGMGTWAFMHGGKALATLLIDDSITVSAPV
ncbi:hypothetical protein FKG94_11250 [Exilibacterium tricleocarpae]|uniref:Cadherin domain-containing protein n=1 Tax=Exilibacterium tricleocarpae TaxID=2591008 RepID=A0A545TQF3_9GAMM|nr:cadherin repeat domain-containing protein [Exilibacterium tricleocarpae]TQV79438.1 hypothetical protein FKG94_11250 [Exilibacterium tricleocarpae]